MKDSLVITAVGGGTEVIPFLTVYAVLPLSVAFLVAFSFGSQRFSRATLFYIIIISFLGFFVTFAFMYPHHQVGFCHFPLRSTGRHALIHISALIPEEGNF